MPLPMTNDRRARRALAALQHYTYESQGGVGFLAMVPDNQRALVQDLITDCFHLLDRLRWADMFLRGHDLLDAAWDNYTEEKAEEPRAHTWLAGSDRLERS